MSDNIHTNWVTEVFKFWFSELEPKHWFIKSDAHDTLIRQRFQKLHQHLIDTPTDQLLDNAQMALCAVIVFDQFPRNMFRNTAASFANDAKALELAKRAINLKFDQQLTPEQRIFMYLPYEHSENLADQDQAVALISALDNAQYTRYAEAHREVIQKFGRFPHRNAALGRSSTPQEEVYLATPGSGF